MMKPLPVTPVDAFAAAARANTGIVPPWLQTNSATQTRNPGIVPPWLQGRPSILPQPVSPARAAATGFDPTPIEPELPWILPAGDVPSTR